MSEEEVHIIQTFVLEREGRALNMCDVYWVPHVHPKTRFFQGEGRTDKTYHNENCADSYELSYTSLGQSCESGVKLVTQLSGPEL